MQKLIELFKSGWDEWALLFLLVFIPLYPKLPLLDVVHTWVYVRIENFIVLFVFFFWGLLVWRREITLKTPLTLPIFIFWIIGLVATIHGILLIFSSIGDAYPSVAFLSFLRRMEYMSLFFVAYAAMKEKRFLHYIAVVLIITLLGVAAYGIGQKYFETRKRRSDHFKQAFGYNLGLLLDDQRRRWRKRRGAYFWKSE